MQDEFYSWENANTWQDYLNWAINHPVQFNPETHNIRFMEVVCLGGDYDDLTVSEAICARFSDEEIQLLGLTE